MSKPTNTQEMVQELNKFFTRLGCTARMELVDDWSDDNSAGVIGGGLAIYFDETERVWQVEKLIHISGSYDCPPDTDISTIVTTPNAWLAFAALTTGWLAEAQESYVEQWQIEDYEKACPF